MRRSRKLVKEYIKNLVKLSTDFILVNKFDRDQTNHLLGTMKALNVSIQRRAGGGATRIHQQALLPRDGNRLRGGSLLHGHRHPMGVSVFFFFFKSSLTGNGDAFVSEGKCEHHTQPTRIRTRI